MALPVPPLGGGELPDPEQATADLSRVPPLGYAETPPSNGRAHGPARNLLAPPDKKITFDILNFGQLEAYYHQIIRKDAFLILVSDKRFVGTKYTPRHSEAQLGAHIDGTDRIYLLRTTGIQFELDDKEICILVIENEGSHAGYLRDGIFSNTNVETQHAGETSSHLPREYSAGEDQPEAEPEEPQGF